MNKVKLQMNDIYFILFYAISSVLYCYSCYIENGV